MTDHEHKLIERGIDNDMLALLEWVRTTIDGKWWMMESISDAELLKRYKNRDK